MGTEDQPLVSVVISNYNGAAYLEAAIASVLNQSHKALELIVVDDASEDDSPEILRRLAATDTRLNVVFGERNAGPAAARNVALSAARGEWIAIVDADDLVHPNRIERLLIAARQLEADIIADDLLSFGAPEAAGQTLLTDPYSSGPCPVTLSDLINSDSVSAGFTSLGYLKPLIRRAALRDIRYDETLRVGEDFDLYCRLLIAGLRFRTVPDPTYLYRRHRASISHRLSVPVLNNLVVAHDKIARQVATMHPDDKRLQAALKKRQSGLERTLAYQQLVDDLKARRFRAVLRQLLKRPALIFRLINSLGERRQRSRALSDPQRSETARTLVLAHPARVNGIEAPENAICLPVPSPPDPCGTGWAARRLMASRLAVLASDGPVDVIAEGSEGQDAMGYLPHWRSARLAVSQVDARRAARQKPDTEKAVGC